MRVALCLGLIWFGLVPCAVWAEEPDPTSGDQQATNITATGQTCPDSYRICPGDKLYIAVEGEDLFTGEFQVNGAGTISYPLVGDVKVAGFPCGSFRAELENKLGKYLRHPQVMVTVREYGQVGMSIFVMGEVRNAGVYPLVSGSGLMQPVAAAGGLTEYASGEIKILKGRTGEAVITTLDDISHSESATALLEPGDVIIVERKEDARYAVLGEVPNPGMFDIPAKGEVRVLDAMMQSGLLQNSPNSESDTPLNIIDDPTRVADLEHSIITRGDIQIPVDLAVLLQGDASQNLVLQPGDVLTIPQRAAIRVYALGEVRTAGRQDLPEHATVLNLLEAAGGMTSTAYPTDGTVLRMVEGQPTAIPVDLGRLLSKGDLKQNIVLQEGDVLFVPPRGERNQNMWRLLTLVPYLVF